MRPRSCRYVLLVGWLDCCNPISFHIYVCTCIFLVLLFFYYYYLFSLFLTFLRRKRATVGTKEKCIHMPTHNLNSLRKPSCVVLNKFSWILGFPIMLGATWGSFTHHWIVTLKIQVETLSFLGLIIWKTSEDLQGGECCGWLWSAGGGVFFWM